VQNPAKWSAFVRSVLKNGLKMRELGPPCVALLAALCASKYSGLEEENKEQQLIADMLQSHSGDLISVFNKFFCLLLFEGTFSKIKSPKEVTKQ
jgi:hypothetical protein